MKRFSVVLAFLAGALAGTLPFAAAAAGYPDRPITLVIPLGAGGSHDLHARGITGIISDIIGQPMVVKLMPGGAGMRGTTYVAQAKPDGYTILFTHNGLDQLVPQTQKVPFDPLKDFKTIARINAAEPMFMAREGAPFTSLKAFIDYAKQNPGMVNFGHSGVWGALHTPTAQLIKTTGIKVNLIPHKGGGPALQALLAKQDDIGGLFATQARPHVKAGKLIPLAVAGSERLKDDPDFKNVPTTAELGFPQVSFTMDRIFVAPAEVPQERLEVLRDAFQKLTGNRSFKRFMSSIGEDVEFMGGAEYDKQRSMRYAEFGELIKTMTAK